MEHGFITTVNYENGVVTCDVNPVRLKISYSSVPVLKPHASFIQVPKQGEIVTMERLDDGTRFITNIVGRNRGAPSSMDEGEFAIHFDKNTSIYFEERNDGKFDINLSASGDVNIEGNDTDVNIDSDDDGDVYINGTGFDEHQHEYTDTTDDSTSTKTTDPPQ